MRVTRGRHDEVSRHQGDRPDRQVDPEHRAPIEVTQQQSTGDGAERHSEAGEPGPDGDRPAALAWVAEHVGQDRQRRRHDQRPADAHERSARDQVGGRRRQCRRRRADGEQDDAGLQRALATEAVTDAAGRQQQPCEHEGVGIDDPLDLAVGGTEIADQRGDRHVEDRVVHDDDQQRQAQHAQRHPAPSVYPLCVGRGHGALHHDGPPNTLRNETDQ